MAILRWISQKGAAAGYSLRRSSVSGNNCIFRSPISSFCGNNCIFRYPNSSSICGNKLGSRLMMMSNMRSSASSSWTLPSRTSPWLMLPPTFEGGDMIYNFYNLAEDKVESFKSDLPHDCEAKFVGSSHGWLALFNQRNNNDLFLSNPLTGRQIKLPPVHTLPDPEVNFRDVEGGVSKVIISCSPEEEECRAVMTYGPGDRLAFCRPSPSPAQSQSSTETDWKWNTLSDPFFSYLEDPVVNYANVYEDLVYCSSKKRVVSCTRHFEIHPDNFDSDKSLFDFEDWDLHDEYNEEPTLPQNNRPVGSRSGDEICRWWKENKKRIQEECMQIPYLVYAGEGEGEELYLVMRFVKGQTQGRQRRVWFDFYPYITIGFSVFKVEHCLMSSMEGSLDGLAMFVGMNHSFALSAAEFPGLKPNSIYFTDAHQLTSKYYCGHDIGIFDYENKTTSPCYYPCCDDVESITRIVPPPMWFTPSK